MPIFDLDLEGLMDTSSDSAVGSVENVSFHGDDEDKIPDKNGNSLCKPEVEDISDNDRLVKYVKKINTY